jgi:methyl-accepting chemotaxis protein
MLKKLVAGSLMRKLVTCFVVVSIAQILIVGYLSFYSAKFGLEQAALNKLDSERELRKEQLLDYLIEAMQSINFMAQTETTRSNMETLRSYYEYNKPAADTPFDANSELYNQMYSSINPFFRSFLDTREGKATGYDDIYLVSASDGTVMYSALKLKDLGSDTRRGDLKGSGLAKLLEKVIKTRKPAMVDFEMYAPAGKQSLFLGVPILGIDNSVDGMLALRIGPEKANAIFGSVEDTGATDQAYLVGGDSLTRTGSALSSGPTAVGRRVDTQAARSALEGKSGTGLLVNDRNVSVLTSYSPVGLKAISSLGAGFDWAVIAEVGSAKAFAAVEALKARMVFLGLLTAAASIIVALVISKTISKPVVALSAKVEQIGKGDLTAEIPALSRHDEVGMLARSINGMANDLREQISHVTEGTNVLSSSAVEISTTVAEVATSSAQTSSSMTEIMVTVEQLRQAAQRARDRAKSVADSAQESVKTSAAGRQATDDTIRMMRLIQEQMASIGETVVRLSDHTRAIGDIMTSVQDLADQSNLLAVNASIEAARAGEHGKGFAVVAQEIKTLADQSRQSTLSVRSILEETRKWVGAVVMAAEQGGKAVEAGVRQSLVAGEAIEKLYGGVEDSAGAAHEIQATSDQQSAAIDQVSSGISSIELSMRQNVSSTSQLDSAARKLADLGEELKKLVERYHI